MLRPVALLLAAAFLLAGCSSPPDPAGTATEADSTSQGTFTVVGDNQVDAPLFTDTYHFLAQPGVTPHAPDAYEPVRIPVTSIYDRYATFPATPPTWDFALPQDVQGLIGTATVWVEVTGTVTGNPFSQTPTGGCFWSLDATVNGDFVPLGCLTEGLQVQPGIYELHLVFSHPDRSFPAGTQFQVSFTTGEFAARAPGTTVDVLTASIQYDSVLQIYGLRLPLDQALLLSS
jgi:hypothetical protein